MCGSAVGESVGFHVHSSSKFLVRISRLDLPGRYNRMHGASQTGMTDADFYSLSFRAYFEVACNSRFHMQVQYASESSSQYPVIVA